MPCLTYTLLITSLPSGIFSVGDLWSNAFPGTTWMTAQYNGTTITRVTITSLSPSVFIHSNTLLPALGQTFQSRPTYFTLHLLVDHPFNPLPLDYILARCPFSLLQSSSSSDSPDHLYRSGTSSNHCLPYPVHRIFMQSQVCLKIWSMPSEDLRIA